MAYDAEIRVGTRIDTSQMQRLQVQINRTTDRAAQLVRELEELRHQEIPTEEYREVQRQIEETERKLNRLLQRRENFHGNHRSASWLNLNSEIEELQNSLPYLQGELQDLVDTGRAFTLGEDTEEFARRSRELSYVEANLRALNTRQEELIARENRSADGFSRIKDSAKKAFTALTGILKNVDSALERMGERVKKLFKGIHSGAERTNGLLSSFMSSVKRIPLKTYLLSSFSRTVHSMLSGMKEIFLEFAKYSKECNAVMSDLKGSLQTLKYGFVATFSPVIQMVVPYLTQFINVLNAAISKVAEFFAAITGRSTFYKAVSQQADFAGSLEDTADAAKKAAGALAGFDRLNVIDQDDGSGSKGSGAITDFIEEVSVGNDVKKLADKVKEILSDLFAPMKEAWNREGRFVINAWKTAMQEIWALAKDVGRDFLIVWNQEETIRMFSDILHILGDIGLVAGNLAKNFRKAWNENKTGLHIFENIRDILAVVITNIRKAVDYTVGWSEGLDFSPILVAFEKFTESLIPVADTLSGILTDFYEKVLLPLGKWTLEKGLPKLLDVFTAFNEKVDWKTLRENLAELWEHLEPFAETVGEGLILFIGRISDALAGFLNSEKFKDFLVSIEQWMDNVDVEEVADGLEKMAKAIITFKAVKAVLPIISSLVPVLKGLFYIGRGIASTSIAANLISGISSAFVSLGGIGGILTTDLATIIGAGTAAEIGLTVGTGIIGGIVAAIGGFHLGQWLNELITGEEIDMSWAEQFEEVKRSFSDGSWKDALNLWRTDIENAFIEFGLWQEEKVKGLIGKFEEIKTSFKDGSWKDALDLWGKDIKAKVDDAVKWIKEKLEGLKNLFSKTSFSASALGIGAGSIKNFSGGSKIMQRNMDIPQLASGAVIRGGNPFLAILGDQPAGHTNVEAPLSTIKQALKEGIKESGMAGGGMLELNVYLTGKQIYHEVVKQDHIIKKSTGKSGFVN